MAPFLFSFSISGKSLDSGKDVPQAWIRYLYLSFGIFFLGVGIAGIFLPLLPATPFLLLAAWCLERGSERFHAWLLAHPWLGPPIHDWRAKGAIRPRVKALATAMMVGSGTYLLSNPVIPKAGKVSYVLFSLAVLTFIWTRKSR